MKRQRATPFDHLHGTDDITKRYVADRIRVVTTNNGLSNSYIAPTLAALKLTAGRELRVAACSISTIREEK